ncbi:hypothetical protein DL93DRAFT_765119 [Clavulina sp. PMI_390]|nr:hypothetical protein DL93DRAFT_765119 [Clavulina sp. PMI_390]
MLTITNRACWTLDGDLLLVAGVVGIVAIWNWREGTWAVAKLSLLENDGSDSTNEELRAVRYPRVTMVGPDLFAVNFATDNGLACHFLKLPTLFPSFEEAAEKVQRTQVARVHLSHTYLVGVFLPSWLPVSKGKVNTRVQMLIWNDLRMECQGRYISLVYDEPAPPELPRHLMRRRLARAASSDSGATDSDDDMLIDVCDDESTSSAIDALPLFSAWTDSAVSTAEPDAEPPSQLVASSAPADITLHQSPFVMLPRPGLFDETVSGRLACIGCEANVARSQIIDGPGSLCGSGASSSSSSSTAIGVLPRVVLGKCVGVKEFSYMDCWSGVMGVADLNVGAGEGMVLKTFVF